VEGSVVTFVQGPAGLVALWTVQLVSLTELSVQVIVTVGAGIVPVGVAIKPEGACGATANIIERIMMFSS
jgi:hypothetical protein